MFSSLPNSAWHSTGLSAPGKQRGLGRSGGSQGRGDQVRPTDTSSGHSCTLPSWAHVRMQTVPMSPGLLVLLGPGAYRGRARPIPGGAVVGLCPVLGRCLRVSGGRFTLQAPWASPFRPGFLRPIALLACSFAFAASPSKSTHASLPASPFASLPLTQSHTSHLLLSLGRIDNLLYPGLSAPPAPLNQAPSLWPDIFKPFPLPSSVQPDLDLLGHMTEMFLQAMHSFPWPLGLFSLPVIFHP